ncbi:MAG: LacI family DNA-binding transcriptional regulator [Bacteroidota bacterium]
MKKVSLRDIADELGVSKTLVSLVLNGKAKENRISQEVIDKVTQVAKEKGYEPNQFAKALRTGKSKTIGLIVADISNAFYAKMARSIEDEAYSADYTVLFGSSDEDVKKAEKLIRAMMDRQIEGLIISPTLGGDKNIELLEKNNIPYILVDRSLKNLKSSFVGVDNYEASYAAVTELITKGCKKIAHITFMDELSNIRQRQDGYLQALKDGGLTVDKSLIKIVSSDHAENEIRKFITSIKDKADAYFLANNEIAINAIKHLHHSGVKIGNEVKVTTFDEHEAFHLLTSPIGVISQPVTEIGEMALNLLLTRINNDQKELPGEIILPTAYKVING